VKAIKDNKFTKPRRRSGRRDRVQPRRRRAQEVIRLAHAGLRHRAPVRTTADKLGVISLGCDKATVDSERLRGRAGRHGAVVTPICGCRRILIQYLRFHRRGQAGGRSTPSSAGEAERGRRQGGRAVGCLIQRSSRNCSRRFPKSISCWDSPIAPSDPTRRNAASSKIGRAHRRAPVPRRAGPVRYLKISEGCDHTCAFCAIFR